MSRTTVFFFVLSSMAALATTTAGCGGSSGGAGPGDGVTGGMTGGVTGGRIGTSTGGTSGPGMPGQGGMVGPGVGVRPGKGMGGSAVIVVGIPTTTTTGTSFPGGGPNGSGPLAPGCTPASAGECPSASGVCATSATSKPTGTTTGSICFYGPTPTTTTTTTTTTTGALPAATIEYLHETAAGQEYYRFRITFDPAFVDNTYGTNAIGWGQKGHTFKDLVGSDHAELSLFDGTKTLVSMFDLDYITAESTAMCGYDALGGEGGEGKMLVGDAKHVLASTTSLDRNLNGCGYCSSSACGGSCTTSSPATDAKYTVNAAAPNWDYRVVYESWIDAAVFAGKGFGGASITFVHASPSKASSNTVTVTPKPCCPPGQTLYETDAGPVCKPGGGCPTSTPVIPYQMTDTTDMTDDGPVGAEGSPGSEGTGGAGGSSGTVCICPAGYAVHGNDEFGRPTCEPTPPCPTGYVQRIDIDGGTRCFPLPSNGTCPTGFTYVSDAAGARCN